MAFRFSLWICLAALPVAAHAQAPDSAWVPVATTDTRMFSLDVSRLERTDAGAAGYMAQVPTPGHEADFDTTERRRLDARGAVWTDRAPRVARSQTAFEVDCAGERLLLRHSIAADSVGHTIAAAPTDGAEWRPAGEGTLSGALVEAVCAWRDTPAVAEQTEVPPELIGGMESLMRRVEYPDDERRAWRQGRVVVGFVVGTDGLPTDFRIVRSVSPGLDAAAIDAIREARFTPGRIGGRPVPVRFQIPVAFALR